MAKVKITGHASGTGILTVTAPNTSTDRTITLPDATGTLLNSDGDGSNLSSVPAGQVKVGSFTRVATTASGTQAVTGVGFQPVVVLLTCSMGSSAFASFGGYDDATTANCIADYNSITTDTYLPNSAKSVYCVIGSGNNQVGKISSMDSGGFTFSWTLTGAGHGYTMTVNYVAFR